MNNLYIYDSFYKENLDFFTKEAFEGYGHKDTFEDLGAVYKGNK